MLIFGLSLLQNYYMKKMFLLALISGLALPVMAQKNKKSAAKNAAAITQQAPVEPDQASSPNPEQMRMMHEYSMPGPRHMKLNEWAGHWQETAQVWIKPGGKPAEFRLMSDGRTIMEGRFLQNEIRGMMNGRPYEGQEIIGWDNSRQLYVSSLIDNQGTGILSMEGQLDEPNHSIIFTGVASNPAGPEPVKVRVVWTMKDPNNIKKEFYMEQQGKEMKTMEINMIRN